MLSINTFNFFCLLKFLNSFIYELKNKNNINLALSPFPDSTARRESPDWFRDGFGEAYQLQTTHGIFSVRHHTNPADHPIADTFSQVELNQGVHNENRFRICLWFHRGRAGTQEQIGLW